MKGNCYQGCAYCCYRIRPGVATIYQRENGKIVVNRTVSDFRMVVVLDQNVDILYIVLKIQKQDLTLLKKLMMIIILFLDCLK